MTLTVNNVAKTSFDDIMEWIVDLCVEQWVPEDPVDDDEALQELDRLVAHYANMYGYVIALYSQMSWVAHKLEGMVGRKDAMRKRDALYEAARSLRYKHEAASRRITVFMSRRRELFEGRGYASS